MRNYAQVCLFAMIVLAGATRQVAGQPEQAPKGEDQRQLEKARKAVIAKDWPLALEILRPLANAGNPSAQVRLGQRYLHGEGVPQDKSEALSWFKKAAAQGSDWAQFNIGYMYANGDGVEQNDAEALSWFQKAAEQGDDGSQYVVGSYYAHGTGVSRDDKQAASWYRKAAEQEHPSAQFELGKMYLGGNGVEQDLIEGYKWLAVSATNGNDEGKRSLEELRKKLTRAQIEQGEEAAENWLGRPSPDGTCTGTTAATVLCLSIKQKKADAELNETYQRALKAAQEYTRQDVENLREAERQWIAYRDAACKAEYGLWGGGSGGPAARISCIIRLTELRIGDFKSSYLHEAK